MSDLPHQECWGTRAGFHFLFSSRNLFVLGHVMALKVESRPVEACAWIEIQGAMCIRVPQIDQFVWILVFCLNSCLWFMVYGLLNPFIVLHCNYKQWGYQAEMRFSHNFWLGAPIDTRSMHLNCILQDLFRDTPTWPYLVRPNTCPNMPNMAIYAKYAYLGAYLGARNMVKWGVP